MFSVTPTRGYADPGLLENAKCYILRITTADKNQALEQNVKGKLLYTP